MKFVFPLAVPCLPMVTSRSGQQNAFCSRTQGNWGGTDMPW